MQSREYTPLLTGHFKATPTATADACLRLCATAAPTKCDHMTWRKDTKLCFMSNATTVPANWNTNAVAAAVDDCGASSARCAPATARLAITVQHAPEQQPASSFGHTRTHHAHAEHGAASSGAAPFAYDLFSSGVTCSADASTGAVTGPSRRLIRTITAGSNYHVKAPHVGSWGAT